MEKNFSSSVAFAGRRIDAQGALLSRFPLTRAEVVYQQLEALFDKNRVGRLVCSAACGADLIALELAQKKGIDFQIVLPFAPDLFRVTSVVDRPGCEVWNWGVLYDRVIEIAEEKGELVVVETGNDRYAGYQEVNHAILDEALRYGRDIKIESAGESSQGFNTVQAVIAWDGQIRGARDLTWHFAEAARSRGLIVKEIFTLEN